LWAAALKRIKEIIWQVENHYDVMVTLLSCYLYIFIMKSEGHKLPLDDWGAVF
jgi:hypothetical protein